ncbi:hypothetical protein E2C01_041027 [Portunus trituberculatus]|uniref:Uncharacterized protein n=1 Tax=Portunus trituberculatus TaxID=210409 RepID=A0A5B7FSD0_PORTR|nr:hypothetical protein [Portunus trituberculatus]
MSGVGIHLGRWRLLTHVLVSIQMNKSNTSVEVYPTTSDMTKDLNLHLHAGCESDVLTTVLGPL